MRVFYTEVSVEASDGTFQILLDGKTVKTPSKETLLLPTKALADAVAAEWTAQQDKIKPDSMPMTKLANTAIDRVGKRMDGVAAEVAAFAGTDLLCYRADDPAELIALQNKVWDPYLTWVKDTYGADLNTTNGIMPIKQSDKALEALTAQVKACDKHELTVLHELTNGFGSLVLALAYFEDFKTFDELWAASLLDQSFQEEQWGLDYEVEDARAIKLAELKDACTFLSHVRS